MIFPDECSNERTDLGFHECEKAALSVDGTRASARTGRCQRSFVCGPPNCRRDLLRVCGSDQVIGTGDGCQSTRSRDTPKRKHPPRRDTIRNRDIHGRVYGLVGREDHVDAGPDQQELNAGRVTCYSVKVEFGRTANLGGGRSHDPQRRDE
jgi:hypothetical protein